MQCASQTRITCYTGMVNRAGVAVMKNCGVLLSNRYGLDSLTLRGEYSKPLLLCLGRSNPNCAAVCTYSLKSCIAFLTECCSEKWTKKVFKNFRTIE